ncbi:phytanoyl-CoA dioxygenase family protein [Mesorhizobium sp. 113-3-3]|uniref:phytanoyl-CoA dioxygenase family protein n=1 Tax=Mesorhizobium sp. 113-3-3 TaxID=2744516 RepID=UPI0018EC0E83|nr:phytanoyl-CoA dioxygenase family protein [Mesorhizobium sp. 113-3-3]
MKSEVTEDQVREYQERGFVHIPGLLSPAEVAELKAAVLEAVEMMAGRKIAPGGVDRLDGDDRYYDKVFTQRINVSKLNQTIHRYIRGPEIGNIASALARQPAMRIFLDQALIKEPYGNPTAWHLDNPYWPFYSRDSISIWIALEDATPLNGCLSFVPGSHKLANFDNVDIGKDLAGLFKIYPGMAETDPVAVPMPAGDCSFHNGLTAHGAGANMTRRRRIAMTAGFMPDGSTFNGHQGILPTAYFESLKVGDKLCNDTINPIVGRA